MSLGSDDSGVTELSLNNLIRIKNCGYVLTRITLSIERVQFHFTKNPDLEAHYSASGISFGYGGEGAHGLWKAIRLWHPDKIGENFWDTEIPNLQRLKKYVWDLENGFQLLEDK